MPDHSKPHLAEMARKSANRRRVIKLERLIESASFFEPLDVQRLQQMLEKRLVSAGGDR